MELKLTDIDMRYQQQYALQNFNHSFTEGVCGLLGANGAGKTTLLHIITGLLTPIRGTVCLDGENTHSLGNRYYDHIGFLPQYPVFYKQFKLTDFLLYMCVLKGIPSKQASGRVEEVLSLVNLTDERFKKIGQLSGGMRQRLGVAQAILNDPAILILDKPTAGLDPHERVRFRNIISRLSGGRIVIIATHIVSDIESIANDIVIMKQGHVELSGSLSTLSERLGNDTWECTADEALMQRLSREYAVSNLKRDRDHYVLRIVSSTRPCEHAVPVAPGLEDIFHSVLVPES